jgi:hypothetical protein
MATLRERLAEAIDERIKLFIRDNTPASGQIAWGAAPLDLADAVLPVVEAYVAEQVDDALTQADEYGDKGWYQ